MQSISFRLADSVPAYRIDEWKEELAWSKDLPNTHPAVVELRRRICRYEDLGRGACWLKQPPLAKLVQDALLNFHEQRYVLIAWCIMPNHVHCLIEMTKGQSLEHIVKSWKAFTGRRCNRLLGRSGPFWMKDYFDRYMRNARHYRNTVHYIEENPCAARLVDRREDWPWSSAGWNQ